MKLSRIFFEQKLEELGPVDSFRALRLFARGKITERELLDSDDNIYQVKTKNPLGSSELIIEFDSEEDALNAMGLSDDDNWFARMITGTYSDYEFYDWHSIRDTFLDGNGFYFRDLNDENIDKLNFISMALIGKPFFSDDTKDSDISELFEKMDDIYEREFDNIIREITYAVNAQMSDSAQKSIMEDLETHLSKFDLKFSRTFDRVKISVVDLINLYATTGKYKLTIAELLEFFFENEKDKVGGWSDNSYEFEDLREVDWVSLNNSIEKEFDKIIESLEDEKSYVKEFIEFHDKIISKFKIDTWYELPKDKDVVFRITGFSPEEMKVNVQYKERGLGHSNILTHKFTEENFLKFLHHPELFPIWK